MQFSKLPKQTRPGHKPFARSFAAVHRIIYNCTHMLRAAVKIFAAGVTLARMPRGDADMGEADVEAFCQCCVWPMR